MKNGAELLYGPTNAPQLFFDFPDWKSEYAEYQPDPIIINELKPDSLLAVEIFFGTWCEDSQREVPHFLKIIDRSHFCSADNMYFYAVDRNKQLNTDLCNVRNIDRVATFIFYRSGNEIGRIIESPLHTLEQDIYTIINKK
jgi:hypothetical protein